MDPAHIITLFFLLISSVKDLRTMRGLKDKYYIAAIILIALSFGITQGPGTMGASLVQALIGIIIGILLRILIQMGGADVWTLSLITASFPSTIALKTIGITLIPLVLWLKIYRITGKKKAPAIPALLAGFILCLSIL